MYRVIALPYTLGQLYAQSFVGLVASTIATPKDRGSLCQSHTPQRIKLLYELMDGVRIGDSPCEYVGRPMTPGRTLDAAAFSMDYNDPHVGDACLSPFKERIAHGAHALTEGMEAFRQYLGVRSIALQPYHIEVEFRQPVFLRRKPVRYEFYPREDADQFTIQAYSEGNTLIDKKPVIIVKVSLKEGIMSRKELGYHLYSGWLISSLLAKTWSGCLFYQLTLSLGEFSQEESSSATVRKVRAYRDKHDREHFVIAVTGGRGTAGQADIIPA